jgi:fluoride exporter
LPPLRDVGLVAAGGAVGGLGRAAFSAWFPVADAAFPWSTWAENVVGAYLLGLLLTLLVERAVSAPWVGPLLATGLLGAFTTFATLSFELARLWSQALFGLAAAYAGATAAGGLSAVMLGMATARGWILLRGRAVA